MTTRKSITSVAIQALLLSGVASAQNTGTANLGDGNYISIDRFTSAAGASSVRDVTYYDGLGYPVQEQSLDANTSHGTLVRPIVYDDMRRDDANGNMAALKRLPAAGSTTADLTMSYAGNRLVSVSNFGSEQPGTFSYEYESYGNMTKDSRKSLEFSHNVL